MKPVDTGELKPLKATLTVLERWLHFGQTAKTVKISPEGPSGELKPSRPPFSLTMRTHIAYLGVRPLVRSGSCIYVPTVH